jgi:hypothetical protein
MRARVLALPSATFDEGPSGDNRTVAAISAALTPVGGTTKSWTLRPVPLLVVALIRPDAAADGIVRVSAVAELMVEVPVTPFSLTVVAPAEGSKFVPVTVTEVPAAPVVGVKLAIVGAPGTVTTKSVALVAVFPATVTVTLPVVAPLGTVVLIEPESDALTVALTPLNLTALLAGVALKPEP